MNVRKKNLLDAIDFNRIKTKPESCNVLGKNQNYINLIENQKKDLEEFNKYKSEYDHNITGAINSVIRSGYRSAGRKIRNPVRKVLEEIVFDNEFLRPINYSSRLNDLGLELSLHLYHIPVPSF